VSGRPQLTTIEALRGLAASSVVVFHVARHLDRNTAAPALIAATRFGHAGVDVFFVLSGFVILFVHRADIGRPEHLAHYARRRATRILPTYWIALAATLLVSVAAGHGFPPVAAVLWSASLLPSFAEPLLGVAWTLKHEAVFYAAFCILILNRQAGLGAMALWLAAILLRACGWLLPGTALPSTLFAPINLQFFFGMAVAWQLGRRVPRPRTILAAGIGLFVLAAAADDAGVFDATTAWGWLPYGAASAMLVLGLVEAERTGLLASPGWLQSLGAASYVIYLFQFVLIGIAWHLLLAAFSAAQPVWLPFAVLVACTLLGGIALRQLVERPLLRALRPRARRIEAPSTKANSSLLDRLRCPLLLAGVDGPVVKREAGEGTLACLTVGPQALDPLLPEARAE